MTIEIGIPSGLTPTQVIEDVTAIVSAGVQYLGQPELAALVRLAGKILEDGAARVERPSPQQVLTSEVDAADVAADAAERERFGG